MNWLSRLFGSLQIGVTPSPTTTPTNEELVSLTIKTNVFSYQYENQRADIELVQGTVTACLNARAQERGVIKFIARQSGQSTLLTNQIERVLNKPNPVQSRVDFMEACSQFHDATGQAAIYIINGDGNYPAEMWVLPSFYLVPVFSDAADPVPSGYQWADGRAIAANSQICLLRNTSIKTAPYTGRGFLGEATAIATLYDLITKAQINYFRRGGAPNVALKAPAGTLLTDDQIRQIQQMWHDKYNPADGTSNVAILPDGLEPTDFGKHELDYNASKEEIRDSIREIFQTPKIILGDTDNVNHNNGQTALAMFERLVVLRWGQKFASALESHFKREYASNITIEIDPSITNGFTQLPAQNGTITLPTEDQFDYSTEGGAQFKV